MPAGYGESGNTDARGPTRVHINWLDADAMAFVCDQYDDCPGFMNRANGKGPDNNRGGGGWLKSGTQPLYNVGGLTYFQRNTRGPVASAHKPNQPSVLENPETKVSFYDGGNFDGERWEHGRGVRNGGFGGEDRTASIIIPLGYKFIGFSHYTDKDFAGQWQQGSGDSTGIYMGPASINGGQLSAMGMADKISSFIIEQVPFDVNARWDDMTNSQYRITSNDARAIKEAYCRTADGIQNTKCSDAGLATYCPARSTTCYAAATDITCPNGYNKDVPNNRCTASTGTPTSIDCSFPAGYEPDLPNRVCRAKAVSITDFTCPAGYSKDLPNNKCKAITGTVATVTGCPSAYNADPVNNRCAAKAATISSLTCPNSDYFTASNASNKCVAKS